MSTRRRPHVRRTLIVSAIAVVAFLLSPGVASAHRERPVHFPNGSASTSRRRKGASFRDELCPGAQGRR